MCFFTLSLLAMEPLFSSISTEGLELKLTSDSLPASLSKSSFSESSSSAVVSPNGSTLSEATISSLFASCLFRYVCDHVLPVFLLSFLAFLAILHLLLVALCTCLQFEHLTTVFLQCISFPAMYPSCLQVWSFFLLLSVYIVYLAFVSSINLFSA